MTEQPSQKANKREILTDGDSNEHLNKLPKREYMTFRGPKHTRVGTDYQVGPLPSPSPSRQTDKK